MSLYLRDYNADIKEGYKQVIGIYWRTRFYIVLAILFSAVINICLLLLFTPDVKIMVKYFDNYVTPFAQTNHLSSVTSAIDLIISKTLRRNCDSVSILKNIDNNENWRGVSWRASKISLQLLDIGAIERCVTSIESIKFPKKWSLRLKKERDPDSSIRLELSVRGFPTHKIMFFKKDIIDADTFVSSLPQKNQPKIAILIDDLGEFDDPIASLWNTSIPFSVSIVPYKTYSLKIAEQASISKKEVLAHIPMDSISDSTKNEPILGNISYNMTKDKIKQEIIKNINAIPFAVGINNHRGSAITRSIFHIEGIMEVLQKQKMYFVDSYTITDTIACKSAKNFGVPCIERNIVLDQDLDKTSIENNIIRLKNIALSQGFALGIAHANPETIEILSKWFLELENYGSNSGFKIVLVSQLFKI